MGRLSSYWTFVYKYVFVLLWSGGFGGGVVRAWRSPGTEGGGAAFLIAWLLGTAFVWWGCARLKRVRSDGDCLRVSNYLREIEVPLRDVTDVYQYVWLNIGTVKLQLDSETPFGRTILFIPPMALRFLRDGEDPIVTDLRSRALELRGRQPN